MYIPMIFPGGSGGGGDEDSVGFSFFTGLTPAVAAKGIIAKIFSIIDPLLAHCFRNFREASRKGNPYAPHIYTLHLKKIPGASAGAK